MNLVKLKGSEKQVKWAEQIRKDRIKVWQAADPDGLKEMASKLAQQERADWWITNRDKTFSAACGQLGAVLKTLPVGVPSQVVARKSTAAKEVAGGERVWPALGFTYVGPTRSVVTGEVVVDESLPF